MRKKNYQKANSDEENEFDVDEPEAIQNNASEDEWTPDRAESGGRRTSGRLRNIPKSRAPIIDASSSDEGSDNESSNKRKGKGRGRPPPKKSKVSSSSTPNTPKAKSETNSTPAKSVSSDSEPSSTTAAANNTSTGSPTVVKVNKDFSSGAFIVLKTDAAKLDEDPPLWKIDGKALLQKYIPFEQDGQTLYKNTSVYSGWTVNNKNNYFPVTVIFKQQTRKDHIVEFKRDQIKKEDLEKVGKETENDIKNGNDNDVDDEDDEEDEDEDMDEENEDEEEENEDEENEEDEEGDENEENDEEEKNGDNEDIDVKEEIKTEDSDEVEVKKEIE